MQPYADGTILYHGSTIAVEHIDLTMSRHALDFGKGFYTTGNYEQACRWSEIKYSRNRNSTVKAKAVSRYLFKGFDELDVKEYKSANRDWLEFIVANRNSHTLIHGFDLVIGPIADDTTLLVVNSFMNGLYGQGESAVQMAISLLKPEILENQYAFCTERAISTLKFVGCDYL